MNETPANRLQGPVAPVSGRVIAPASIVVGSLIALIPIVATVPILPPFGLLMLIGWRLRRPDVFAPWAAVPLGLFDDLISGQPLGSAMLLWTLAVIALDVLETRLVWRDFWLDWLIAAGALAFCLLGGRLVATPIAAHVDSALIVQILSSTALFPLAAALIARLDRRRGAG